MELMLDTSRLTFTVARGWMPKLDQNGVARHNRDNVPLFVADLMARDQSGGVELVRVTVAGVQPEITLDARVVPVDLEAIPWSTNGKHGVAFRASAVTPVPGSGKSQAAA
jgi:hypothetical protein